MAPKQRQVRVEQRGGIEAIQALEQRSDEELEAETKYKAAALAILGARASERFDADAARGFFQRAIAAARPQERMQIRRMADASLALAERRAGDLKERGRAARPDSAQRPPDVRLARDGAADPARLRRFLPRIRGILLIILLVIVLLALGLGIVELIALPFGGLGLAPGILLGLFLVIAVLAIIAAIGRRRRRRAKAAAGAESARLAVAADTRLASVPAPVCLIVNPAAGGGKAGRVAPSVERGAARPRPDGASLSTRATSSTRASSPPRRHGQARRSWRSAATAWSASSPTSCGACRVRSSACSREGAATTWRACSASPRTRSPHARRSPTGTRGRSISASSGRGPRRRRDGHSWGSLPSASTATPTASPTRRPRGSAGSCTPTARCARCCPGARQASRWSSTRPASATSSPATRSERATPRPTAAACMRGPDALLDDGLLEVVICESVSKLRFLTRDPSEGVQRDARARARACTCSARARSRSAPSDLHDVRRRRPDRGAAGARARAARRRHDADAERTRRARRSRSPSALARAPHAAASRPTA